MAVMKQTVILAVVVLGFWFPDGAVALPNTVGNPPAPPGTLPQGSMDINGGSSDFVYSFDQGKAILDYDPSEKRMTLVGTDIFGGEVSGITFKRNRTARWDLDVVFEDIKREFKDCVRNKNPDYSRFHFQRVVEYTGNLKEGGQVTGTLRLDAEAASDLLRTVGGNGTDQDEFDPRLRLLSPPGSCDKIVPCARRAGG